MQVLQNSLIAEMLKGDKLLPKLWVWALVLLILCFQASFASKAKKSLVEPTKHDSKIEMKNGEIHLYNVTKKHKHKKKGKSHKSKKSKKKSSKNLDISEEEIDSTSSEFKESKDFDYKEAMKRKKSRKKSSKNSETRDRENKSKSKKHNKSKNLSKAHDYSLEIEPKSPKYKKSKKSSKKPGVSSGEIEAASTESSQKAKTCGLCVWGEWSEGECKTL